MTTQNLSAPTSSRGVASGYRYEERLGESWPVSLTITALNAALCFALVSQIYTLTFVLVFCCVGFGVLVSRRRAAARRTLPISYVHASPLVFAIAVFALILPGYDDPSSALWRAALVGATTLIFYRFVGPGYHPLPENTDRA